MYIYIYIYIYINCEYIYNQLNNQLIDESKNYVMMQMVPVQVHLRYCSEQSIYRLIRLRFISCCLSN